MKIYFTRHGETLWNTEKRFQGWKNSELTPKGLEQANLLRNKLKNVKIDRIYSSPIERAYKTAKILQDNRDIEIVCYDELKEMNFGEWEGLTKEEILKVEEYKNQYNNIFNNPKDYKTFGGETIKEFSERLYRGIEKILSNRLDENILIVTHGMCIKYIIPYFIKDFTDEKFSDLPIFEQTSYNEVEYDGTSFEIIHLNNIDHYLK